MVAARAKSLHIFCDAALDDRSLAVTSEKK